MTSLILAKNPPPGVGKSRSELLELDGVDERVDGGVCVAKPEHKAGPARGEGKLKKDLYSGLAGHFKRFKSFNFINNNDAELE